MISVYVRNGIGSSPILVCRQYYYYMTPSQIDAWVRALNYNSNSTGTVYYAVSLDSYPQNSQNSQGGI